MRYLVTGFGYEIAAFSIVLKTIVLLVIMVTGAIWEKVVFGQYLLASAFFWEDIVSFFVIALRGRDGEGSGHAILQLSWVLSLPNTHHRWPRFRVRRGISRRRATRERTRDGAARRRARQDSARPRTGSTRAKERRRR